MARPHQYPHIAEEIEGNLDQQAPLFDLHDLEIREAMIEKNIRHYMDELIALNTKQRELIQSLLTEKRQRNQQLESEIKSRRVVSIGTINIGTYKE